MATSTHYYEPFTVPEHVEGAPETSPHAMLIDPPSPVEIPDDPWAHRAQKMRCRTCMWWAQKGEGVLGRCRRHAPTMSGYPATYDSDWCGDHKVDETKL